MWNRWILIILPLLFFGCADTMDISLSSPQGDEVNSGDSVEIKAEGSDYDELKWYLDDNPLGQCKNHGTCRMVLNTIKTHTISVKATLENNELLSFNLEEDSRPAEDSIAIRVINPNTSSHDSTNDTSNASNDFTVLCQP